MGSNKLPTLIEKRRLTIRNERGLHARAAAQFVSIVSAHNATVTVCKGGQAVSGESIMGLMMLAATAGSKIDVHVEGPAAKVVAGKLEKLVEKKFGEG
ncbi:MAG: hypothetical protein CFH06_01258 [Alphaproteobacteria bacterium MarineAlpha3_Bin5]|nr:HPr family phosphocarrier protein [Magnetovibrio sp.]PPR77477.1 MAG: hypothetical protein CFH06_01258 [Alphaproteobacteria bacterium MarineAlpha3_Bin5]|tara:strand:+ start:166 stop:459 length:294 start_codon:yes stop_codon:yes gene_type:complete